MILDQNGISGQLFAEDRDTLTLDEVIEQKIFDAIRYVLMNAPVYKIGSGKPFADIKVIWNRIKGIGSGYFLLPKDFLRLVSFQMSDWRVQVNTPITEDNPLYLRQKSMFRGVRGTPQRPVVALVNHSAGLCMEFYSCTDGENTFVKTMRYIALPRIEEGECENYIEIPQDCYDAVKYYIAYLVATTFEMQSAAVLAEQYKLYM